jgi:hypothetical protein
MKTYRRNYTVNCIELIWIPFWRPNWFPNNCHVSSHEVSSRKPSSRTTIYHVRGIIIIIIIITITTTTVAQIPFSGFLNRVYKYFAGHLRRRTGKNHNKLLNSLILRGQSLGDTKYIQLKVCIKQDLECHVCSYCTQATSAQANDSYRTWWITFIVRLLSKLLYAVYNI